MLKPVQAFLDLGGQEILKLLVLMFLVDLQLNLQGHQLLCPQWHRLTLEFACLRLNHREPLLKPQLIFHRPVGYLPFPRQSFFLQEVEIQSIVRVQLDVSYPLAFGLAASRQN